MFRPNLSDELEIRVVPSSVSAAEVRQEALSAFQARHQAILQHRQEIIQHRQEVIQQREAHLMARREAILEARTGVSPASNANRAGLSTMVHTAGGLNSYGYGYASNLARAQAGSANPGSSRNPGTATGGTGTTSVSPGTSAGPGSSLAPYVAPYGYGTSSRFIGTAGLTTVHGPLTSTTGLAGSNGVAPLAQSLGTSSQRGEPFPNSTTAVLGSTSETGTASPSTSNDLSANPNGGQGLVSGSTGLASSNSALGGFGLPNSNVYGVSGLAGSPYQSNLNQGYASLLGAGVGFAMGHAGAGSSTAMATGLTGSTGATLTPGLGGTTGVGTVGLGGTTSTNSSTEFGTTTGTGSPEGPFLTSSGALVY
ncbi:MAG TPA: hypothetical protein VFT74_02255 [Isosphaeraceae bacterium]|nr:hypothetical protein [Isosphaeraceae bacterium]